MIVETDPVCGGVLPIWGHLITIHPEAATGHVEETLDKIHTLGCKTGLSIKLYHALIRAEPYPDKTDMILIMTVEPDLADRNIFQHPRKRSVKQEGF